MRLAIIGAGAAGCYSALLASELNIDVILIEKNDRIGKKILVTGNGKCNLSNKIVNSDCYESEETTTSSFLDKAFQQHSTMESCQYFKEHNLLLGSKGDYIYPLSGQASTVLDFFRYHLENPKIQLHLNTTVLFITKDKEYEIKTNQGYLYADYVLITTGGKAAPKTGSDGNGYSLAKSLGHHIIKPYPALVQIICKESIFKAISGIRVDASISYKDKTAIHTERGELQITDYGISGIPVFQLSIKLARLLAEKSVPCVIDFMPDMTEETLYKYFMDCKEKYTAMNSESELIHAFCGCMNKKLLIQMLKSAGLKASDHIISFDHNKAIKLAAVMKSFWVTAVNTNGFEYAQVTSGGVPISEVSEYLESRFSKGLFFAGEVLDVTGKCGGYNLQWAWTSSYLAVYKGIAQGVVNQ